LSRVFPRQIGVDYPTAVAGEGAWIIDRDGKRYLDACGGAAVSCLGHGHPRVVEAVQQQIATFDYGHTSFFTSEPAERLADRLIADAPPGIEKVYYISDGSEAVEAALKMARQYFLEIGEPKRARFIARRQSYHGGTLGALAVGGNAMRRAVYGPLLIEASHIAPCYPYRDKRPEESEENYGRRVADELEAAILAAGPQTVAAFLAETVVGATLGCVPAVAGYFKRIREICDRYGVLLILDEIMCGMGRTGTLHACAQEGIAPDLMTIAKGLGGGYQPIGALLVSGKVFEAFARGSGSFQHGHTYVGHPVACAAGLAVQEAIAEEGLLAKVRTQGERLREGLIERFGNHRHVGDIRGRGLFLGIELVEDRASKAPFDPARRLHAKIKAEAKGRGLLVYPMPGTIDGKRGDHIVIAPPFTISDAEIEIIVDRLGVAVEAALAA